MPADIGLYYLLASDDGKGPIMVITGSGSFVDPLACMLLNAWSWKPSTVTSKYYIVFCNIHLYTNS